MSGIKITYRVRMTSENVNAKWDREASVCGLQAATVGQVAEHLRSLKAVLDPDEGEET